MAAALSQAVPDADLAATLANLQVADVDDAALVEVVAGWERLGAWVAAQQASAIAELTRRACGSQVDLVPDEVACRLAVSRRAAEHKVELAVGLDAAPAVHEALATGAIDVRKAAVLVHETDHLPPSVADEVRRRVLERAGELTAPQVAAAVRRAEIHVDAQAAAARHERARAERCVQLSPTRDAMAWVRALLPAADAMVVIGAVDALAAAAAPEDERGVDARRADALVDVMRQVLDTGIGPQGPLPTTQRRHPHLNITLSATAVRALSRHAVPSGVGATRPDGTCAATEGGAVRPDDRPVRVDDRPLRADDRPLRADDRPLRAHDRPLRADDRQVSTNGGAMRPDGPCASTDSAFARSEGVSEPADGAAMPGDGRASPGGGAAVPGGGPAFGRVGTVPTSAGATHTGDGAAVAGAAQLSGYGLVPLAAVRDLAQQAAWRAVAVDDRTGEVVARSSRAYRPSPSLAALVIDRDVTCTFPGCRVPAVRCDLDHITAFDQDRPAVAQTTEDNLQALCRHHHRLKTHESWTPERDPATGVTTWISPTGHRYTRDPVPADPDYIDPPRRPPRRTVPADPPRPARGLDEPECEEASQHPSACAADASCGPDSACASGSACAPGSTGASDTAPTLEAGRDSSPGLGVDDDREAEANAGQAVDRDPDPAAGPSKPGDGERDGRDSGIKPDGEGAGAR